MKHQIIQVLNRHVVADHLVVRLVQSLLFVTGISMLVLSLWKLSRLDLTEAQLFCGVLISPITPMLFIVLGVLFPMAFTPKSAR